MILLHTVACFILHQVDTSCGSLRAGGRGPQVATRVSLAVVKKVSNNRPNTRQINLEPEVDVSEVPPHVLSFYSNLQLDAGETAASSCQTCRRAPLRLFQPHPSKPLSVSPLCIPTARRCGGDSATPPARCPATSIQTLSLNPQRTGSCQPSSPDGESCEKGGGSRCSRPFDLT